MRLYNTLTREVEEVVPIEDGHVKMYTCGPTVYRYAHLGNLRTFMLADLIRRALEFEGFRVTQVMNITDVGHMTDESSPEAVDKMLLAMEDEGLSPAEIAAEVHGGGVRRRGAPGIRPADRYPKATEHIPEMVALTQTLVDNGHAYVGGLRQRLLRRHVVPRLRQALAATRWTTSARATATSRPTRSKRPRRDFALWKAAGPGRVMKWASPWGEGFPGWHVECSAMSMKYLGERFDIHTGGTDLRFPHHEDEIAQSEGAVGHQVVNIWVHGGHLRLAGQKIAKSTGNVVRVQELRGARASTPCASAGSRSRRATAARWTSPGTRWRTPTAA